jgi:selenocysteine lyase/cysteine desulfurase
VDFLASLAGEQGDRRARLVRTFAALHARGEALLARMWQGLSGIPGVTLYGPPPGEPRTPTVGFAVAGHASEDVARALVASGVYASNGDFYASTLVERLGRGADGLVRAGAACYTTGDEVDRLVAGVAAIARA